MATKLMPVTVRMDEDFYADIIKLAAKEGRSINKQMVRLLQIGYESYQPEMPRKRGRPKK